MQAKRPPDEPRTNRSLVEDERAIEGLPIRLVIALVVGVASLAIMMNMLTGLDFGNDELTVEVDPEAEEVGDNVEVTAIEVDTGEEVDEATLVVHNGTAGYSGDAIKDPGDEIDGDDVHLQPHQDSGYLEVEVQPPSDSNYEDNDERVEVVYVDS